MLYIDNVLTLLASFLETPKFRNSEILDRITFNLTRWSRVLRDTAASLCAAGAFARSGSG